MRMAFVFAGLALMAAGCASGEGFVREDFDFTTLKAVAIIDVSGPGSEAALNQIGDFFGEEFFRRGYAFVERAKVGRILAEQKFQSGGFTANDDAARAGKVLNADAVVIINVPQIGEEISISAKMVDTETATVLWMGSGSGSTVSGAATLAGAVIGAGAGAAAGSAIDRRGHQGTVAGAVAGGLLGGVAGHALEPRQADIARKVVRKICGNLPSLVSRR